MKKSKWFNKLTVSIEKGNNKMIRKIFLIALLTCTNAFSATKNIEVVIPFAPGGATDVIAQSLLPHLRNELADSGLYPVIVYKPGAGSIIGNAHVANNAQAQFVLTSSAVVTAPLINQSAQYNPATDFRLVSYIGTQASVVAVNATSNIKTIKDLQTQCRQTKLNYGHGGIGTAGHIVTEITLMNLGCSATNIPYKAGALVTNDLLGGHIVFASDFYSGYKQLIDTQQLRPLLVFGNTKIAELHGVPNYTDAGFQNFNVNNWVVVAANRAVSPDDIKTFKKAMSQALKNTTVQTQLKSMYLTEIDSIQNEQFFVIQTQEFRKILNKVKISND